MEKIVKNSSNSKIKIKINSQLCKVNFEFCIAIKFFQQAEFGKKETGHAIVMF
jgi:hypothetical protein